MGYALAKAIPLVVKFKNLIAYLLFNYIEFGVFAIINMYFVSIASESELARSSTTYLLISYSAFCSLGLFGSIIKEASMSGRTKEEINFLLRFGQKFLILTLIVFACVIAFIIQMSYSYYISLGLLIGMLNLIKNYCQNYFRINLLDKYLNLSNVFWVMIFVASFAYLSLNYEYETSYAFFLSWALGLLVSYGIALILISINLAKPNKTQNVELKTIFNSAVHLLINTVGLTIVITADRLVIKYLGYSDYYISIFQFSDSVTNVFFLGLSSIIYYLTPTMFGKYSSEDGSEKFSQSINYIIKSLVLCYILFMIISLALVIIVNKFSYEQYLVIACHTAFKAGLILYSVYLTFLHSQRMENLASKSYSIMSIIILAMTYIFLTGAKQIIHEAALYVSLFSFLILSLSIFFLDKKLNGFQGL